MLSTSRGQGIAFRHIDNEGLNLFFLAIKVNFTIMGIKVINKKASPTD